LGTHGLEKIYFSFEFYSFFPEVEKHPYDFFLIMKKSTHDNEWAREFYILILYFKISIIK
jgi:hypothetical protein